MKEWNGMDEMEWNRWNGMDETLSQEMDKYQHPYITHILVILCHYSMNRYDIKKFLFSETVKK